MIIVFNGPPGSGKDEAANYFKRTFGYDTLSFKQQLFRETTEYFGVDETWFMKDYDNREIKERPEERLGNRSRREALIYVSEEIIKPNKGKDYFGKCVASLIHNDTNYAISDSGFVEELEPIIEKVGESNVMVIQLTRRGCCFSHDSRRYLDCNVESEIVVGSETPINPNYVAGKVSSGVSAYRIHNNGTIEDFYKTLFTFHYKNVLTA